MKIDKIKTYGLELLLMLILLFAIFESSIITKNYLMIILVVFTLLTSKLLKVRSIPSIYKKESNILLIILGLIYVLAFYTLGLFKGFYKSTVLFSFWSLLNYIIPIGIIIVISEYLRYIFISSKAKFSSILTFIDMVLIDLYLYLPSMNLVDLDELLVGLGFVTFASISSNLLYNYIVRRYEYKGVTIYKLITNLYMYIIPVTPDIYIYFRSILKMVYPYIIYLIYEYSFAKKIEVIRPKEKRKSIIFYTGAIIFSTLMAMLISCQFTYGIMVIGTGSMTGTLNKGDTTIYKRYNDEEINVNDIILFKRDDKIIIHRVIDKSEVNGIMHYYTKGDYNMVRDSSYVTAKDIVGIAKLKIPYIGNPTIWLRELFVKE